MPDNTRLLSASLCRANDRSGQRQRWRSVVFFLASILWCIGLSALTWLEHERRSTSCASGSEGYWCQPRLSHFWGQYSAYFRVPSELNPETPEDCGITFVQVLSRHGARSPTAGSATRYRAAINKLKTAHTFDGPAAFLEDYEYDMPEDLLTDFGRQQMIESGMDFVTLYPQLSADHDPFMRAAGSARVVESAQKWAEGFNRASSREGADRSHRPQDMVVIPETRGFNNSLTHGLCDEFENKSFAAGIQHDFAQTFTPAIRARLNSLMPGADLEDGDVISLMEMCPFTTVAEPTGAISPFCDLFTPDDFRAYNHFASLGKYYGYGKGNHLGPTQGVGFVNEVIARLTRSPVRDASTTNHTLDADSATFPLNASIYADFTHDNVMTSVLFAFGLYSQTPLLSNDTIQDLSETRGYSSAHTVPFAGRVYIEKMVCAGVEQELVRAVVNGRVVPLDVCKAVDELGRCAMDDFVASSAFARGNGRWAECFAA